MSDRIAHALAALFDKHRIIFWYDAKKELRAEFEALSLPEVEKLETANNEYALKYRILREQPGQKFLLYHEGPQPDDLHNWLLDILLANGEFRTDQVGLWLSELELGLEFAEVIQDHLEFFRALKRKDALKKRLKPNDTAKAIRLNMLAVCVASETRLDTILESLLQELADERDEKIRLVERCGLASFFWKQMESCYGYSSQNLSIKDFAVELFKFCYATALPNIDEQDKQTKLSTDAQVFLKRWKDNRKNTDAFITLSEQYANVLGIAHDLEKRDYRDVLELDYFRIIDLKVISALAQAVSAKTISHADLDEQVRLRRQSIWHDDFQHLYEAIAAASQFLHMQELVQLEMGSPTEAVERYCQSWFALDQFYRRFVYHARMSTQPTLLGKLAEQVENLYANNFVLKLGNRFQELVGGMDAWKISSIIRQDDFFMHHVALPFLRKDNKVCVIISDALRYEIGEELQRSIRQEDKYEAELSPMLSMLPSYTQLGMAALLPHKDLSLSENDSGTVLVDGQPSVGMENRNKILQSSLKGRACATSAETVLGMDRDETRELLKANDVLYIYHNRIDAAGDKRESESKVFEAAQETINELVKLVKKLAGNSASNILVSADHGFLYQDRAIDESDFADAAVQGTQVFYKNRRFVLGHGLVDTPGLHSFTSAQLGLTGEMEMQIPKSINRLRVKGAGSRYVHGGASLQEVIIPVIKINKKRQSDTSVVDVQIVSGTGTAITSGQLAVTLYQKDAVTDKIHPRTLRAGIYTEDGELVSDSHELTYDKISANPRDREQTLRFILTSKADKANGKDVWLRLEERLAGTGHYTEYATQRYTIRRSFTSDFDL